MEALFIRMIACRSLTPPVRQPSAPGKTHPAFRGNCHSRASASRNNESPQHFSAPIPDQASPVPELSDKNCKSPASGHLNYTSLYPEVRFSRRTAP